MERPKSSKDPEHKKGEKTASKVEPLSKESTASARESPSEDPRPVNQQFTQRCKISPVNLASFTESGQALGDILTIIEHETDCFEAVTLGDAMRRYFHGFGSNLLDQLQQRVLTGAPQNFHLSEDSQLVDIVFETSEPRTLGPGTLTLGSDTLDSESLGPGTSTLEPELMEWTRFRPGTSGTSGSQTSEIKTLRPKPSRPGVGTKHHESLVFEHMGGGVMEPEAFGVWGFETSNSEPWTPLSLATFRPATETTDPGSLGGESIRSIQYRPRFSYGPPDECDPMELETVGSEDWEVEASHPGLWESESWTFMVHGNSADFAISVLGALKWIVASIQQTEDSPHPLKIGWRTTCDSASGFLDTSIHSTVASFGWDIHTQNVSYCWLDLFQTITVNPQPEQALTLGGNVERPRGLEIEFSLLLQLAVIDGSFGTDTDEEFALVGFDTALVPLEPAESRKWHLITTNGHQITPARIRRLYDGPRLRPQKHFIERYCSGTVFVGWSENPRVEIGSSIPSEHVARAVVDRSSGLPIARGLEERADRGRAYEGSFQPRFGFLGSSLGVSLGTRADTRYAQVNVRAKRSLSGSFERMIDAASAETCVLWDQSTERAWLLPSVLVLFFAGWCYAQVKGYQFDRPIKFKDSSSEFVRCACDSLRESKNFTRVDEYGKSYLGDDETFGNIVRQIWQEMSRGQDLCASEVNGRLHYKKGLLFGYDLREAICGTNIHLRQLEVTDAIRSWESLVHEADLQVLFCSGIGTAISCGTPCCSAEFCREGRGRGSLTCVLSTLKRLIGDTLDASRLPIGKEHVWIPRGPNPRRSCTNGKSEAKTTEQCTWCTRSELLQVVSKNKMMPFNSTNKLKKKQPKSNPEMSECEPHESSFADFVREKESDQYGVRFGKVDKQRRPD
ncbi:hypothetical protein MBLNU459_g7590t1 [Dothideomycetes sp. NU459]